MSAPTKKPEEKPIYVSAIKRQIHIHKEQIPTAMKERAIGMMNEAMDQFQLEKDTATFVKKKCDEVFGGTWHCISGRNFGCSITHDTKFVLFLKIDLVNVLLFKSLD